MKFRVTFEDILEDCASEEDAYERLLDYLADVVHFEDVTAFEFTGVEG